MPEEISFVVLGHEPIPKQSFRYGKHGGYQPERVITWARIVNVHARQHCAEPMDGYFEVALSFYRKTKRNVDVDNLSKNVLDALNGVIWHDDRQVVKLHLSKRYVSTDIHAGVKVEVWRVEDVDAEANYA